MIVPTLGRRIELLEQCLASIAEQSTPASIVIVAPTGIAAVDSLASRFNATLVPDPGSLAGAINAGVVHAGAAHEFVNWSGDDDLLEPGSLEATVKALDADPERVLAYGACRYIDAEGSELWISRAGKWAPRILKWGPDLIPQPGMLVRRAVWEQVGGLDESFKFAFDLDLLLKLQVIGGFVDVGRVVSSFRWHGDSLTVGDRSTSLAESERARRLALSPGVRNAAWLWERPVRVATRMAANELHRRAARRGLPSTT
jgi:GT2 family glycosyltransferase